MSNVKNTSQILICDDCHGKGIVECKQLTDYHRSEYRYWDEACNTCKGSGRLVKVSSISIHPYIPGKEKAQ